MEHFIYKDTKSPPVYRLIITVTFQDFRCDISCCSYQSISLLFWLREDFRETEIRYQYVSISIQQNVFKLQISIDYSLFVQIT